MFERSPDAVIGEMKHYNIKTVAGCLTRVTCDITAPEGVNTTLTAFLVYEGESRPATLESADVIIFPAVPYGHYAYEIRCGGKPVAFGHLLVRPSAFPHTDGVVDYSLAVDLSTAEAAHVELTLTPGPRGPKGDTGASAYDIATEHGYQGSEADWIAELQGAQAAASAAKASEQAAANSAASAASTLANTAKKDENNTFSGTNTFNGLLLANGGITGLPGPADANAALHQRGGALLAFTQQANTLVSTLSWSKTSTAGTVAAGGSVVSTAVEEFAAGQASASFLMWGGYLSYTAVYLPFSIMNIADGGAVHIALPLGTGGYGARTMTGLGQPSIKYEAMSAGESTQHKHLFLAEFILHRTGNTYTAIVRGMRTENSKLMGMREASFKLASAMVPTVNTRGLTGLLIVRTSETTAEIYLRLTSMSGVKWLGVGVVNVSSQFFSGHMAPVQVGVQGASIASASAVYILAGSFCADAAQVLRAEAVTTTVTDKTFDEYKTEYPA